MLRLDQQVRGRVHACSFLKNSMFFPVTEEVVQSLTHSEPEEVITDEGTRVVDQATASYTAQMAFQSYIATIYGHQVAGHPTIPEVLFADAVALLSTVVTRPAFQGSDIVAALLNIVNHMDFLHLSHGRLLRQGLICKIAPNWLMSTSTIQYRTSNIAELLALPEHTAAFHANSPYLRSDAAQVILENELIKDLVAAFMVLFPDWDLQGLLAAELRRMHWKAVLHYTCGQNLVASLHPINESGVHVESGLYQRVYGAKSNGPGFRGCDSLPSDVELDACKRSPAVLAASPDIRQQVNSVIDFMKARLRVAPTAADISAWQLATRASQPKGGAVNMLERLAIYNAVSRTGGTTESRVCNAAVGPLAPFVQLSPSGQWLFTRTYGKHCCCNVSSSPR